MDYPIAGADSHDASALEQLPGMVAGCPKTKIGNQSAERVIGVHLRVLIQLFSSALRTNHRRPTFFQNLAHRAGRQLEFAAIDRTPRPRAFSFRTVPKCFSRVAGRPNRTPRLQGSVPANGQIDQSSGRIRRTVLASAATHDVSPGSPRPMLHYPDWATAATNIQRSIDAVKGSVPVNVQTDQS